MSRPWPVLITLTFLSSSFAVCDSCTVAGEDQDGVNCTFQSDVCGWNITSGDGVNWRRSSNNGFMVWETNTFGAEEGFFSSKQLCFTENRIYSLEFKYRINLASVCSLSVKLQCAQATHDPVWVGDHKAGNWWLTSPPLNISCPDSTFKIVFLAKKTSTSQRQKCQIRVDDIVYKYSGEDISSSPTTITSATAPSTALPEDVFQPSAATATVTPTTDVSIQPTSREAEGTTAGTSTHKTTDGYADANDSYNGLAIGLGVSVAAVAVVILVVVVIIVIIRRRGSDGNNGGCTGILNRRRKKQEPDTTPDILKLGEMNSTYSHEMQPENVYLRRDRVNPMSQGVSGSHDAAARRPNICVTSSGYVEMENGSFS